MDEDDSTRHVGDQDVTDEEHLRWRYYERLSDWSEPGEIKINRNGKLVEPLSASDQVELRKWRRLIPWARPKREGTGAITVRVVDSS